MKLKVAENNQTWNTQFYVSHAVDYFSLLESGWNYFLALYFHYLCLPMLCPGVAIEADFGYMGVEMGAKTQIFC